MSIQNMVLGFELMTLETRVSSHNRKTRATALVNSVFTINRTIFGEPRIH